MSKIERRSITAQMRVAKFEDGTRTITGLIPYNSESVDLGGFVEVIAPGAFAGALQPDSDVLALRDHDSKLLLGRTKSGTLALSDASDALRYSVRLPNTTAANDLAESVDRGDLDATSFGFVTLEDKWLVVDDKVVRTLLSVELMEVSPCSFPAYPDSVVAVRSCPAEIRSRIEKRDAVDGDGPDQDSPEEDSVGCPCDCAACITGDCTGCTDPDCDAVGCCDDDDVEEFDSTGCRNYFEMTLALRERTSK
jgi:HK97 family phage prohead protease